MQATPSPSPSFDKIEDALKHFQFHLMELGLGKSNLDFTLYNLEENIKNLKNLGFKEMDTFHPLFEELTVHLNSRNRFINGAKMQIEIAKCLDHPHIAELKQLLDQISRHLESNKHRYFISCFQVALVNPGKEEKQKLDQILENIKSHLNGDEQYIDQLHRELTHFYV